MIKNLTSYQWSPNAPVRCGHDSGYMAESIGNYVHCMGLEMGIGISLLLYLIPLVVISVIAGAIFNYKRRRSLLASPDIFLSVLPVAIWFVLAIIMPIGKPTTSFLELVALGTIAGVTILLRWRIDKGIKLELAKSGLLGTMSLAICFWAFMPPW